MSTPAPIERASRKNPSEHEVAQQVAAVAQILRFEGGKLLVDTTSPVAASLRRKRWSASSMSAITSCPARWAIEKLLPEVPDPFGAAELGGAAHGAFEALFALPQGQRSTEAFEAILAEIEHTNDEVVFPHGADEATVAMWRAEVTSKAMGLWKFADPDEIVVAENGIEMKVSGDIDGVPVVGYIDLAEDGGKTPEGLPIIRIRDHKTGKFKTPNRRFPEDAYGDQMRIYRRVLLDTGFAVEDAVLWFTAAGKVREIDLSERATTKTLRSFVRTWNIANEWFDRGSYDTKASGLCGWCPLSLVCRTAYANGQPASAKAIANAEVAGRVGIDLGIPGARVPGEADPDENWGDEDPGDGPSPEPTPAAPHTPEPTASTENVRSIMSEKIYGHSEPWNTVVPGSDTLNGNSYTATAAFATVQLALDFLVENGQDISKRAAIMAMAATFDKLVSDVQVQIEGTRNRGHGINTRLRGALRTAIEISGEPPFGKDLEAWDTWLNILSRRMFFIATAAHDLWATDPEEIWADAPHTYFAQQALPVSA